MNKQCVDKDTKKWKIVLRYVRNAESVGMQLAEMDVHAPMPEEVVRRLAIELPNACTQAGPSPDCSGNAANPYRAWFWWRSEELESPAALQRKAGYGC